MHNLDNAFRRSPEKIEMEKLTLASAKAKKEPANIERMAWHGEAGKFYQGTAGQCLAGRGHGKAWIKKAAGQNNPSGLNSI